jgi:SAM-dependent methyltransferase
VRAVSHVYRQELSLLEQHYSQLLRDYGDTPRAADWRDLEQQEHSMAVLTEVGELGSAKVLDFGCGTGHLFNFLKHRLRFTGEYVGYDITAGLVAAARKKFPGVRFEQRDILAQGMDEDFDYIFISGVFNDRTKDNWGLMTAILRSLFPNVRKALAFNALSTYVDFLDPRLYYVSPEKLFRFCKVELSPCVALRHDYLVRPGVVPFEFSVYVYRSSIQPRQSLEE